jgi:hypothetical protein
MDMRDVIIPKSDQLNSDDLIAGPMTVKITGVTIRGGQEQPISIAFEGDNGKPFKPCKSMCRVLVQAWGPDSAKYAGRSMTLYRDPTVKWAGMDVGGIRISHLSDIEKDLTMALTATRGNRKPFTVKPIPKAQAKTPLTPEQKTAKVMSTFEPLGLSIATLQQHLGKDIPEATKTELEAAYAHFEAAKAQPAGAPI